MPQKTKEVLMKLGMRPKLKGYRYIVTAIELLNEWRLGVKTLSQDLYPEVARIHKTKPANIERDIRYAIEDAWLNGSYEDQIDLFGSFISVDKGKPTNSDFLHALAVYSQLDD